MFIINSCFGTFFVYVDDLKAQTLAKPIFFTMAAAAVAKYFKLSQPENNPVQSRGTSQTNIYSSARQPVLPQPSQMAPVSNGQTGLSS